MLIWSTSIKLTPVDHLQIKKGEVLVDIEYFGQGIFGTDLDIADFSKNVTDDFSKASFVYIFILCKEYRFTSFLLTSLGMGGKNSPQPIFEIG